MNTQSQKPPRLPHKRPTFHGGAAQRGHLELTAGHLDQSTILEGQQLTGHETDQVYSQLSALDVTESPTEEQLRRLDGCRQLQRKKMKTKLIILYHSMEIITGLCRVE